MRERYQEAPTFQEFLAQVREKRELWEQIYSRARVGEDLLDRAREIPGTWRLLALAEDWCGDGASTLPYLARLVEALPNLELRVLARDENPDLMETHLTGGTRSIPVVLILDEEFREVGWWGPRPSALQDLFLREIKPLPKEERLSRLRAWYARDRGRSMLEEVLDRIPVVV